MPQTEKSARKKKKAPKSGPPDVTSARNGTGKITITMLPVDQLRPCGWNPNVLPEKDRMELKEEMRRQGKVLKPIVVIKAKKWYLIIDGEQNWTEAKEAGLSKVASEIIDVDRLEAMRQTIIRNRHGKDNPLLLGRLYERMINEGKLSNRELAKMLGVSEGSVRNYLNYPEAARVRNGYAPDRADELIGGLKTKQVATYLALKERGNEWLDSGAALKDSEAHLPPKQGAKAAVAAEPSDADQQGDDLASVQQVDTGSGDDAPAFPEGHEHEQADHAADAQDTSNDPQEEGGPADEGDLAVAPAPATPAADEDVLATPPDSTDEPLEPFAQKVLNDLNNIWSGASAAIRRKFLAGAMADPITLAIVRQMIKQGT